MKQPANPKLLGWDRWTIRPMVPGDLDRVSVMLGRLSERSAYLRFFTSGRGARRAEMEYLRTLDGHRRLALVADDGTEIVGMARYHLGEDGRADVAVCVVDGWQHRGMGRRLMVALIAAARREGVSALQINVLAENADALRLIRRLAPSGRLSLDHGVLEATLSIAA